jgi:RNA polymerase sigma-70 factor (ECF subfamily)
VTSTPVSLLYRLKVAKPDAAEWQRLQDIYLPLVRAWLARIPSLGSDIDDVAQEVLIVVIRSLPQFERAREGSFRTWLRRVTANCVRTFAKRRGRRPVMAARDDIDVILNQLEDPDSAMSHEWDRQHDQHVVQKLLASIQQDFNPTTWKAFRRFALEGELARVVASELGISENAVLLAKYRVFQRLRAEAAGLIE